VFSSRGQRKTIEGFRFRLYILSMGMAFSLLLIFIQLINLQIIHGRSYQSRSKSNMESFVPLIAPRGIIFDRNFGTEKAIALVSNRVSFNITTIPAKFSSKKEREQIFEKLAQIVGVPVQSIVENSKKEKSPHLKTTLLEDIPFPKLIRLASWIDELPHITWETIPKRDYLYKNMYAHVIGYTGRISQKELMKLRSSGYQYYQDVGKIGLEYQYDKELRGIDGRIRKVVNVKRKIQQEATDQFATPGKNIVLTIDHKIQEAAYRASEKYAGVGVGVVVMRPSNGEILALISKPDFDPNFLITVAQQSELNRMLQDENKPFVNRAIQIKNPPSSTFKPLVGLTALEEGKLNFQEKFFCNRTFILKGLRNRTFHCWGVHHHNDIVGGIANSCNVFFFNVGLRLGSVPILKYAEYFGLNQLTGIDIPGEVPGLIPSDAWKHKIFKQRWFDGDTMNISIGQGFLQFTPIAMATVYAGMVMDGIIYKPHILKEIRDPVSNELLYQRKPEILREVPLKAANLDKIRQGLRAVVLRGTTQFMNHPKLAIAGKTGTVQTFSITDDKEHLRKKNEAQHAWFIGYAPFDGTPQEQVLIAVFVQFGQTGSGGAAPIAYRIFQDIFLKPQNGPAVQK